MFWVLSSLLIAFLAVQNLHVQHRRNDRRRGGLTCIRELPALDTFPNTSYSVQIGITTAFAKLKMKALEVMRPLCSRHAKLGWKALLLPCNQRCASKLGVYFCFPLRFVLKAAPTTAQARRTSQLFLNLHVVIDFLRETAKKVQRNMQHNLIKHHKIVNVNLPGHFSRSSGEK
jgi:hypothetical protein